MKRIFLFNWEIKAHFYIGGTHTIITHSNLQYTFPEKGSQIECKGIYITFLVQTENIIDDKETVLIPY